MVVNKLHKFLGVQKTDFLDVNQVLYYHIIIFFFLVMMRIRVSSLHVAFSLEGLVLNRLVLSILRVDQSPNRVIFRKDEVVKKVLFSEDVWGCWLCKR